MEAKNRSPYQPEDDVNGSVTPPLKIGELLINEGYVTRRDIKKALAIQEEEKQFAKLPLGKILVRSGAINEDDLETALRHPSLRKNVGSLAVEKGIITKDDLELCLKNRKPGQLIGELLVDFGLIDSNEIGVLLKEQIDSPKLGQVLIDLKLITENDLRSALKKQKSARALGEILCDMNLLSPNDLNYVLDKYNKQIGIEEVLVKLGYLDPDRLCDVRNEQAGTSEPIEKILVRKKYLTADQMQTALGKKYNLPFLQLKNFAYSEKDKQELSNLITRKYAEKNLILPLDLKDKNLTISIYRPEQIAYVYELRTLYPDLTVSAAFVTEEKFEELFEILYSLKLSSDMTDDQNTDSAEDIDFLEIDLEENIEDSEKDGPAYAQQDLEAEELVNFVVKYGILNGASDIHIEQDRHGPKLRYRIDGILQEPEVGWLKKKLPEKVGAIISRIKVMSNLDIAEKRVPQDGVFRINYYDKATNKKFDLDFRVATCRAIVGENVTIRILDSRKANVGLENLNHSPHVLEPFKRLLKSSAGMILVSGPTGSGKSSSLYAALQYVYNPGVKIITAEDPIEYSFPGIMQTQILPKIGITFSRLLRSFLRLDPDIILVGEMRDEETATIGFDAAQTGHLLLSTIHTNDSISAVSRLADMNVEYTQIASCLLAVLAQRLIRKICPICKKEYVPSEDEWGLLFDSYPSHLKFYIGEGCESCNFSGYKGRTLISEIFVVDKETGAALSKGLQDNQIKKIALESGMKTMLDDGLLKLHETTLSEILRVVPHDMIKTFRSRKKAQRDVNEMIENLFNGADSAGSGADSTQAFLFSPDTDQDAVIDEMFEKYTSCSASDGSVSNADKGLFSSFIKDSYSKISKKHNCRKVSFRIQTKGQRVEIAAVPEN